MKKSRQKENRKYKTDEVKRYVKILAEDFDSKVKAIAEQYLDIKKILNLHTEMIASVHETAEIMKIDIQFIKNGLKKKVDLEEFQALEKRVALLEAKIKVR